MKTGKLRGITDRALSGTLAQHAGGLNALMQWATIAEKDRRKANRALWGIVVWMLVVSGWLLWREL